MQYAIAKADDEGTASSRGSVTSNDRSSGTGTGGKGGAGSVGFVYLKSPAIQNTGNVQGQLFTAP